MSSILDDTYMKRHLENYILFQVEQGYAPKDIRAALLSFGYKKPFVASLFRELHLPVRGKVNPKKYSLSDLDQELRIYVQSLLIDYIVKEHKVGYDLDAIKKALINYGHDPRLIDEALVVIKNGMVVDYKASSNPIKMPQKIVASLSLFLIFGFLVFLSISTDTSIFTILPNFLPLFVTFLLVNIGFAIVGNPKITAMLPLLSVLLAVGLFIVGINLDILGKAPGSDILLILNAVGAFLSSGIICAFSRKEHRPAVVLTKKGKKKSRKHKKEEKVIEDKIQVPSLGSPVPQEPVHVRGAARGRRSTYNKEHSMLAYLRDEIDKPKRRHHPHTTASVHQLPERNKRKERLKIKSMD